MIADPASTDLQAADPRPYALILAGGLGRRMQVPPAPGDSPPTVKPLVLLAGRPLVSHVIARIRPQVRELWINVNTAEDAFARFGCPLVPDTIGGFPGPLAGVLAGLDRLAATDPEADLLTVPADTPFLPEDLAARLSRRRKSTGSVVCAGSSGQRHPVVALWPTSARAALRQSLEAGRLKVGLLLERLNAVTESWDNEPEDPFFNVNTPEDLAIAQIRASARQ